MSPHYRHLRLIILIAIKTGLYEVSSSEQTFIASFQPDLEGPDSAANDVWFEYKNKIAPSKEFTICHWIKVKFFNFKYAACLWSYCTEKNEGDKMKCIRLCINGVLTTANREVILLGQIASNKGTKYASSVIKESIHRTWSHICWSFSSVNGENRFYLNGKLIGQETLNVDGMETAIIDFLDVHDAAFVFGQEPDAMRGAYDPNEAYLGDLAELNIWNKQLTLSDILDMASCKTGSNGNILAWEKSNLILHNVTISEPLSIGKFCEQEQQYVVFPEKLRYPEAKEVCKTHGGWLALPKSEEENQKLIEIVYEHKESCIDTDEEANAVWIGAKKTKHKWYALKDTEEIGQVLNYTNVKRAGSTPTSDCSYLDKDGVWLDASYVCKKVSLCTVCVIMGQPVLTLKGICNLGEIDWNYYISTDDNYKINMYEGYKRTNIQYFDSSKSWNITSKSLTPQSYVAEFVPSESSALKYPIGRQTWLITELPCGIDEELNSMTLSTCNFPTQFTCNSGHCIDINKRCNEQKDCLDGSDEKACSIVDIPLSYNQAKKPKSSISDAPLNVGIQATIDNIDSIDTVNMIVTITMEIRLTWKDQRLKFFNPELNKSNIIPLQISQGLWTPLQDLKHENAIIGEIIHEDGNTLELSSNLPEDLDPQEPIENRLFKGSTNSLVLTQRMKVKYNCIFNVKKFPFDGENCRLIMKIAQRKENSITFVDNGNITYLGLVSVGQFSVGKMITTIFNSREATKYVIIIPMNRISTNQLLTAFIPTFILWLYGYSTLFIDPDCHIDRFMGAGTALLVVATLLNAINSDLPKTPYMKYIDLWFIWHVVSIFLMISYHIILGRLKKYFEVPDDQDDVVPFDRSDYKEQLKTKAKRKISLIDGNFILVFPILNSIFYSVYFYLTLN